MSPELTAPLELTPVEQRVLGSLLEKERTVPDTYPMTLNGLRTACNQTSGRNPVLDLTEREVQASLDDLRAAGLTRVLHPSHGARQPKYRQVLDEVLHDDAERAVVTLLLLRGPQTPGELRSRAERLFTFSGLDEVEGALRSLAARDEPLAAELERRPGQKEQRWIHRLGPVDVQTEASPASGSRLSSTGGEVAALRTTLAETQAELRAVQAERDRLQALLDELTAP